MLIDMKFISDMIEIRPSYSQTSHLITNTNYSKMKENKKGVKNPMKTFTWKRKGKAKEMPKDVNPQEPKKGET